MTQKKARADSSAEIKRRMAIDKPLPPEPLQFSETEMQLWDQMVTIRDQWEEFDLVFLARLVRVEVKMREYDKMIDAHEQDLFDGTRVREFDSLHKAQNILHSQAMSLLTKMRIMEQRGDPRTINKKSPKPEVDEDNPALALIARPQ